MPSRLPIPTIPVLRRNCFGSSQCHNGFTFVEIVVVILLLSVISAVFIARLAGANSFNGIVVRDQIIALTRIAQQSSFGRPVVTMTFTPTVAGDEATIVVAASAANGMIERVTVPITSLTLAGDINTTTSCGATPGATAITNSNPLVLRFGELGGIIASSGIGTVSSASYGAVQKSVRVCINNSAPLSVCISPIGFAYVGDCDVD